LPFSNFGDAYLENGILAPGKDVKGASPSQNVMLRSGTSFATPVVTGVIALLLSLLRMSGRDADARAVRAALLESGTPCEVGNTAADQQRCLNGILNISGAIAALFPDQQTAEGGLSPAQSRLVAPTTRPAVHAGIPNASPIPALQPTTRGGGRAMGEMQTTGIEPSSHILGPDGKPARAAAVSPAEAPATPPEAAPAGTPSGPAHSTAPAAAVSPSQMPGAPGMRWVQVPVSDSTMAAGFTPASAAQPSAAPTGFIPAEAP